MIISVFILEIIDLIIGCIVGEVEFSDGEVLKLLILFEIENFDYFGVGYDLDEFDIRGI